MSWDENVVRYRRDLHRIPELGFQEHKTQAYLMERLTRLGLEPKPMGSTGLIADIVGRGPGPAIAIRADMDGLPLPEETELSFSSEHPGVMHACGHDGHMAIVLALAERLVEERRFDGTVRILFQPAEELPPGGALPMIEGGALEGIDEIYGLHLWASAPVGTVELRSGPMMANADLFTIRVKGLGGHGSAPQQTKDAVLIASQIVVNLQTIVSRRVRPFEPVVVTCGTIQGGHTFNIIAESAQVTGTVRTFSRSVQEQVIAEIRRMAERTAALYDASAEVEYVKGYPAVINHERQAGAWAEKLRGVVEVIEPEPDMGGEDFAYYLQHRPGAFLFVGAGQDQGESPPHHSPHFLINERALPIGAEVLYRAIHA
ncbi:M20 metallopeptidase family protein [Sulfobacillus harzensis]|uniref:Amidohydrolase n=1 Tax=Sulfobacillus harzensis TaxID=2729629 RepID=A0A7Y0Q2J4_9FIRM|nr:amidohydrolase [Sulfobacillus harzensis]NMP21976.1 amidohydrolase [Sulfobacillus harzensis]